MRRLSSIPQEMSIPVWKKLTRPIDGFIAQDLFTSLILLRHVEARREIAGLHLRETRRLDSPLLRV